MADPPYRIYLKRQTPRGGLRAFAVEPVGRLKGMYHMTVEIAQHTPGPWIAQESDAGRWYIWRHTEGSGECIGYLSDFPEIDAPLGDDVREANAYLIAAAPDLLASCIALTTRPATADKVLAAQAAIAKATGAQS